MSPPSHSMRYGVVQSKQEAERRVYQAIVQRSLAELDLVTGDTIRFMVRTTDHDDQGSLIIGVTDDHRTLNLHLHHSGEVTIVLPLQRMQS